MKTLTPSDLHFIASRIPRDVRVCMHRRNLSIGGGFIREIIAGNEPKDIDLFGSNKFDLQVAINELAEARKLQGYKVRLVNTDNAVTLLTEGRLPVQAIYRWLYDAPRKIIGDFDFTVCAAAIWRNNHPADQGWDSAVHDDFYSDLAARRLMYTSPQRAEDAGGSMLRVIKLVKRGYNIQSESLGKVIARVAMAVKWEQIAHDEARAAQVLIGLLREVDPNLVVDGIEPVGEEE